MNKMIDDELKTLFQQHKKEIPDNGFSKEVGKNICRIDPPVWHYFVMGGSLLIAIIILASIGGFQYFTTFFTSLWTKLLSFSFSIDVLITSPLFYLILLIIIFPKFAPTR